ncbi:MAG: hypothetical protein RJA63_2662 [Pseudomonadota bacterium]
MPLPLIPVVTALLSGGILVPHAAGGMIVSGASGYIAGTYLSTTAIASLYAAAASTVGIGAVAATGYASTFLGGAGIVGTAAGTAGAGAATATATAAGATGVTGAIMSAGIISSTPIAVPIVAGAGVLIAGYAGYRYLKFKKKLSQVKPGEEIIFSESEAKFMQKIILRLPRPE